MGTPREDQAERMSLSLCSGFPADLTILLHAAVNRVTVDLDSYAVEKGLKDSRDWLVLAALDDGLQRTQLELSRVICVDKTTLITVLDRLERQELVVRTVDPNDRRVRIPQITSIGRQVFSEFAVARDAAEAEALAGVSADDRALLLQVLGRIANRDEAAVSIG